MKTFTCKILTFSFIFISVFAYSQNKPNSQRIQELPLGNQLRSSFEELTPQAKANAENWLNQLNNIPKEDFNSLKIDVEGGIYYADSFQANSAQSESNQNDPLISNAISAADVFMLHSKPDATNTVYLDFDGMNISGRRWNDANGVSTYVARPYDSDGNEGSFSQVERNHIASVWQRVSDDFAAFDIDVTTEAPSSFGPNVGHVLITKNVDQNNTNMPSYQGGGVAYVNVFGGSSNVYYSPALVYYNRSGNEHGNANTASHEFGHNLGLSHHGGGGDGEYYAGHGSGYTSWAPLMGSCYTKHVTQWDHGSYSNANNSGQNDINLIENNLGFYSDDHGNDIGSATSLVVGGDGVVSVVHEEIDPLDTSSNNKGIIERATDLDFFSFSTLGGQVTLNFTPSWIAYNDDSYRSSNLDILVKLYNNSGSLINTYSDPNNINANMSVNLSGGIYYISVEGEGSSNYSDYGSLGKYYISGTIEAVGDSTPPVITLIGDASIDLTEGDTYNEQGATASDNEDGDISANIVIGGDIVDTNSVDTYVVTYNVSDAAGNSALEVTRTINVLCADSDNDGVCDSDDICPGGDDSLDADGDGTPDFCDSCNDLVDTDGDGVSDCTDQEIDSPCPINVDSNGVSLDSDEDGVCDDDDICAGGDDNVDSDGDGTPDFCDTCNDLVDTDNDGVNDCNDQEISSPCPSDVDANGVSNDSDGDGVPNCLDICPGGDDTIDTDGDGFPDACDNSCVPDTASFQNSTVQHTGNGFSETSVTIPTDGQDITFTISGLNQRTSGKPTNRYIEEVTVMYVNGQGNTQNYGVFTGTNSVNVSISGVVQSINVSLTDGYDGNTSVNMSIDLSTVDFCVESVQCDDSDGDGVCDTEDQCPGSNDNIDTDGDGIPDGCDTCDDLVDNDNDGVSDCIDSELNSPCPNTVDADGVSLDSDNDGVCDELDICLGFDDSIDSDNDNVPDGCDLCEGFDDSVDTDNDGIPDGCDTNTCDADTINFGSNSLTHSGTGSNSTTVSIPNNGQDVSFTISDFNQRVNGKPSNRYIEEVNVTYIDGQGNTQNHGVFSGTNDVEVNITGFVQEVTVSLTDAYDGNTSTNMNVNLSIVDYCVEASTSPSPDISSASIDYLESAIKVYPNPVSNKLTIDVGSNEQKGRIIMYSANGKLLLNQELNKSEHQLELGQFSNGLYLLIINDQVGNNLINKRIIINR